VLNNLNKTIEKKFEDKKCDSLGTNIIIHLLKKSVIAICMLKKSKIKKQQKINLKNK